MNTLLNDKVKENKNALVDVDYKINLAEQKIEMQEQHINELNDNKQKRINDNKVKIAKAETEKKKHIDAIEELQNSVNEKQNHDYDLAAIKNKKKKLEQFEYKLQDKISNLQQEIEFYRDHDDCPTCKQNIDEDFKCDIVDKKQTNLQVTSEGFDKLQEEYTAINEQLEEVLAIQEAVSELQQEIANNNSQINALNRLIESINEDIESINIDQDNNNANEDKLEELKSEMADKHTEKESLTEEKSILDVASLILKDSGIKTRIIKQYVPVMNKLISKYLAAMDFFVQF